jgi:hypothetical protein
MEGSRTNGFLMAARGTGALLGALFLASLGNIRRKGKILSIGILAERFTLPLTFVAGAFVYLAAGLIFLLQKPWIKAL